MYFYFEKIKSLEVIYANIFDVTGVIFHVFSIIAAMLQSLFLQIEHNPPKELCIHLNVLLFFEIRLNYF